MVCRRTSRHIAHAHVGCLHFDGTRESAKRGSGGDSKRWMVIGQRRTPEGDDLSRRSVQSSVIRDVPTPHNVSAILMTTSCSYYTSVIYSLHICARLIDYCLLLTLLMSRKTNEGHHFDRSVCSHRATKTARATTRDMHIDFDLPTHCAQATNHRLYARCIGSRKAT